MTAHQGTSDAERIVALYSRVSRKGKRTLVELERHTLAEQQGYAEKIVPRAARLLVDERYRDVNVSGKNFDRPGFEALIADIEAGVVHDVVVGYLSRFGRNAAEVLANLARLHELGATVYFGKEGLIAAPGMRGVSKLLVVVLASVAEMEVDRLEDGLKASNATALADGISIQVPYGYRRANGPGSPLAFDDDDEHGPAPADVVRLIFALAADGVGHSEIAERLNADGVPTPSALAHLRGERESAGAASWRHNTIGNIVATRTYKGVIPRATAWADEARKRPIAWDELPAQHDALVSDDVWKDAQPKRTRAVRNGSTGGALLTGLVRCSSCSRTMRPSRAGRTGREALLYVCGNKECPKRARIVRAPVDELVVERLIEDQREFHAHGEQHRQELVDARIAYDELDAEYDRFLSRAGSVPAARFERANADYLRRLEAAQGRVDAAEASTQTGVLDYLINVDEHPVERVREGIASLVDAIVVKPAPGQGRSGVVSERVVVVPKGQAPFELSGTGRIVASRPWPLA